MVNAPVTENISFGDNLNNSSDTQYSQNNRDNQGQLIAGGIFHNPTFYQQIYHGALTPCQAPSTSSSISSKPSAEGRQQKLKKLCKTQWQKELYAEWKDGSTVALGVGEDPRNVGGIGFIVSKEWSKSIDLLDVSRPRIGVLTINLQKQQTLCIIQVYAPTSAADNEEIERFYDNLEEEINKRSTYLVVA
uniref:Uncharacterized protein n=1 Tax=Plectus sambesii TaxID=2011161 RepID=A0A914XQ36_9BILA